MSCGSCAPCPTKCSACIYVARDPSETLPFTYKPPKSGDLWINPWTGLIFVFNQCSWQLVNKTIDCATAPTPLQCDDVLLVCGDECPVTRTINAEAGVPFDSALMFCQQTRALSGTLALAPVQLPPRSPMQGDAFVGYSTVAPGLLEYISLPSGTVGSTGPRGPTGARGPTGLVDCSLVDPNNCTVLSNTSGVLVCDGSTLVAKKFEYFEKACCKGQFNIQDTLVTRNLTIAGIPNVSNLMYHVELCFWTLNGTFQIFSLVTYPALCPINNDVALCPTPSESVEFASSAHFTAIVPTLSASSCDTGSINVVFDIVGSLAGDTFVDFIACAEPVKEATCDVCSSPALVASAADTTASPTFSFVYVFANFANPGTLALFGLVSTFAPVSVMTNAGPATLLNSLTFAGTTDVAFYYIFATGALTVTATYAAPTRAVAISSSWTNVSSILPNTVNETGTDTTSTINEGLHSCERLVDLIGLFNTPTGTLVATPPTTEIAKDIEVLGSPLLTGAGGYSPAGAFNGDSALNTWTWPTPALFGHIGALLQG